MTTKPSGELKFVVRYSWLHPRFQGVSFDVLFVTLNTASSFRYVHVGGTWESDYWVYEAPLLMSTLMNGSDRFSNGATAPTTDTKAADGAAVSILSARELDARRHPFNKRKRSSTRFSGSCLRDMFLPYREKLIVLLFHEFTVTQ